jgi:transposase
LRRGDSGGNLGIMEQQPTLAEILTAPDFSPEQLGAKFWYEQYLNQKEQYEQLVQKVLKLDEELNKLKNRTSKNSSQPPSQDNYQKKIAVKTGKKKGPKYDHNGTTRNGFTVVDRQVKLAVCECPECGSGVSEIPGAVVKREQIAELVSKPVEVTEYERALHQCSSCGWQGRSQLPLGCKEGFSYGGLLSSLVGWLGYGGNLTWSKQRYLLEMLLQVPISQGSLAKMHKWFCQSLQAPYEKWWELIQEPGVRCVDETSYRLNGVNYWIWVATSTEACVLMLVPSRSSREVKTLLGEDFTGILSTDCWSAYGQAPASAKQKCWAHIERELKRMETSHLKANRIFAAKVWTIIHQARAVHRQYLEGNITLEQMQVQRPGIETQFEQVLDNPPTGGWAFDSQQLTARFKRHWSEWFTFLSIPGVKPDNNDAERALRPVVIHRKVSGGARSDWGGQLVAMMFSFLETMRLQGKNALTELFALLTSMGRDPPQTV